MEEILANLTRVLETGDAEKLKALAQEALDAGVAAKKILEEGLFPGMDVVGRRFKDGELFMPEVLLIARAMNQTLEILETHLSAGERVQTKNVVLATVKGDLHDIGKNIVGIMVRGAGYRVIDLGIDVPTEKIVAAVQEHQPVALGLSALLTTTMLVMKEIVEALQKAGLRERLQVLIGGAAVTQRYADEIGADGYSDNAYGAVTLIKNG